MVRLIRRLCRFLIFAVVVCGAILICFRVRYHESIRSLAHTMVRNATSDLINDAVDRQIAEGNYIIHKSLF